MSEYPPHVCQYNCGRKFPTLRHLIIHIEASHIDFDLEANEKVQNKQPTCIPFSYVLRYSTEAEVAEYMAKEAVEEPISDQKKALVADEMQTANFAKPESSLSVRGKLINKRQSSTNAAFINHSTQQLTEVPSQKVRKYSCPILGCAKTYKNQNGMKYHVTNVHDMNTKLLRSKKEYKCKYCEKQYKTTRGLQSHMSGHNVLISNKIPSPDLEQSIPEYSCVSYKPKVKQQPMQYAPSSGEVHCANIPKPSYPNAKIKLEQTPPPSPNFPGEDVNYRNDCGGNYDSARFYLDYNKRSMNYQHQNSSNVLHKKFYECSVPSYSHFYSTPSPIVKNEHCSGDWHELDTAPKQYWVDSKGMPGYRYSEDLQHNKVSTDESPRYYEQSLQMQYIHYYQQLHNATANSNGFVTANVAGFADSCMGISEEAPYSYGNMGYHEKADSQSYPNPVYADIRDNFKY